jgi:hypothetical protein
VFSRFFTWLDQFKVAEVKRFVEVASHFIKTNSCVLKARKICMEGTPMLASWRCKKVSSPVIV